MSERRTETASLDRIARQRVRFTPAHTGADTFPGAPLRLLHQSIQRALGLIGARAHHDGARHVGAVAIRSEEHTSELQSRLHLVCRLLLEKKKKQQIRKR